MILRFMGDMPEPKVPTTPEKEGLAKKAFGSISRKFYGSKIAEELQQQVCACVSVCIVRAGDGGS